MLSLIASPLSSSSARQLVSADLVNENAHGHGRALCACEGLEADHPFTIDCSNIGPVNDAVAFLETQCDETPERDDSFEWGATFDTPDSAYKWVSQAKTKEDVKAWADPSMLLVGIVAPGTDVPDLFALRDKANALMDGNCPPITTGGSIPAPTATGWCYTLTFPESVNTDFIATIDTTGVAMSAFFTNHGPTEFEEDIHYLMENVPDADLKNELTKANEPISDQDMYCKIQNNGGKLECQQAFFILQSHHDFCKHDTLTRYEEELMHMWEKKCKTCGIERQYVPGLKNCPQIDCTDGSVIDAANFVLSGTINDVVIPGASACAPATFSFAHEWGGTFDTPADAYQWVSQAAKDCNDDGVVCEGLEVTNGYKYADPNMTMVLYAVTETRMGKLFNMQDQADKDIQKPDCATKVYTGGALPTPIANGVCVTLVFPADPTVNFVVSLPTAGVSKIAIFTGHVPTEFEGGSGNAIHYFQPAGIAESAMSEDTAVEALNEVPLASTGGHDHGRRISSTSTSKSMRQIAANKAFAKRKSRRLSDPGECCTNAAQIGAWKSVVAYHDLCAPSDVPEYVELDFHNYEQACEDYFCNAVGPNYSGDTCPSPPSPPPPVAGAETKKELSTGAIAGIAIACAVAVLACMLICVLIVKEQAGTPVFAKMDVKKNGVSAA